MYTPDVLVCSVDGDLWENGVKLCIHCPDDCNILFCCTHTSHLIDILHSCRPVISSAPLQS